MYQINIPGLKIVEPREFRYILVNENEKYRGKKGIFRKIITIHEDPIVSVSGGGVMEENFIIVIPNGEKYYGLSYRGDIEGWRNTIEKNAELENRKFGKIINKETFWVNDNTEYNLKDCEYFVYGYRGKDYKVIKELMPLSKYFENDIMKLVFENNNVL
jgi:hypothetical protein